MLLVSAGKWMLSVHIVYTESRGVAFHMSVTLPSACLYSSLLNTLHILPPTRGTLNSLL